MTELKVEKKRRFPVLWTILAIVAIGVIVWIVVDDNDALFQDDTAMNEEVQDYNVESGYAEAEDWNGNDMDPWAGDTVWDDNEVWGDDSDVADDEYTLDEDENTFGGDYSGAVGTDVEAPGRTDRPEIDSNDPNTLNRSRTETEFQTANVDNFISFADDLETSELNRRTAHEGLSKLTMALSAVTAGDMESSKKMNKDTSKMMQDKKTAMRGDTSRMDRSTASGSSLQSDLRRLRQQADQLKDNRMSGMQASVLRSSFMEAATILQEVQTKHYPDLQQDATEVMDAAQEINAEDMASNQRSEIKEFFDEASDVLEKVKEQETTASNRY